MLTEFFNHWNPFNLYGSEVQLEDLIDHPLSNHETLMQDAYGHYRRILAPSLHATLGERFFFWLQTHLNQKGHLEAIDQLLSLFYEHLLEHPPILYENLKEINYQLEQLRSLKNDYSFVYLKMGDPSLIELRLNEIEQEAFIYFALQLNQQALAEEEKRKGTFILFQEYVKQRFDELAYSHLLGLQKARLLMVASSDVLRALFDERVQSLFNRLGVIEEIQQKVEELEQLHQGKFTIPHLKEYLRALRIKLYYELRKIKGEANTIIGNLIINYQITPFNETAQSLLLSLDLSPTESLFTRLDQEIIRIRQWFESNDE